MAEMDYPLAPSIKTALSRAIDDGDSGYVDVKELPARKALADYARDVWGWSPSLERMGITTDVSHRDNQDHPGRGRHRPGGNLPDRAGRAAPGRVASHRPVRQQSGRGGSRPVEGTAASDAWVQAGP